MAGIEPAPALRQAKPPALLVASLSHFVYAAGGVIHHLRAMPTALDCILLYQYVKDLGGCTVATRVHSSIPYGVSGLLS